MSIWYSVTGPQWVGGPAVSFVLVVRLVNRISLRLFVKSPSVPFFEGGGKNSPLREGGLPKAGGVCKSANFLILKANYPGLFTNDINY